MADAIRRVLVIGATGLVGREAVRLLGERPGIDEVVALVRRDPGPRPSTRVSYRVVDFDHLVGLDDALAVDAMISALGTTRRLTPDPAMYRHVEVEIPLAIARRVRDAGARRLGLVSSLGADPAARSRYLRQKGELEASLRDLDWERLVIARPSVLRGPRPEFRLGERLGIAAGMLLPGRWRPVDATRVAARLVAALFGEGPAVEIVDNEQLRAGAS